MKKLTAVILLFNLYYTLSAQLISSISASICDSIHQTVYTDDEEYFQAQRAIYHHELIKYPTLIVDITDLNKPRQFNEFNYKINRELLKSCSGYQDQFSLLPLSKILDLEGLLNKTEYDSLERAIIEFIHLNKMDLVVITIEDLFPYENFEVYSEGIREKWNIGARYNRGGIVVVYSKFMKDINVSLSKTALTVYTASEIDLLEENIKKEITDGSKPYRHLAGLIADLKQKN